MDTKKEMSEKSAQQETAETSVEQSQLRECEQKLQDWKEQFVRARADLENFKRRVQKERVQWMQHAQADVIKDLLSILDDFSRALEQKGQQEFPEELESLFSGFTMIGQSLSKSLQQHGLVEITEHDKFDPNIHEAIAQVESPEHESGSIVEVVQKGYRLKDKVLRPAKVTVAQ